MSRRWVALGTLLLGCMRSPVGPAPVEAGASTKAATEPVGDAPPEPEPTPVAEPEPAPSLVLVDEDWVWNDEDPSGPLLRIVELQSANDDDPAAVRALLRVLEPLMICYELELGRRPGLMLGLTIRRTTPTDADGVGLSIEEAAVEPTGMPPCAARALARALPPHDRDPQGRYVLRFFPRRDEAPPLPLPHLDDTVIEREGGACFTVRTHPCKPHKHCMSPTWERTRCKRPAELPRE